MPLLLGAFLFVKGE